VRQWIKGGLITGAQLESNAATRASLIQSILTSAHSFKGDLTWGWVADLLDNKILASKYFALDLGLSYLTGEDNVAKGIAIAKAVSSTSYDAAKEMIGIYDEGYYLKLTPTNSSLVANGLAQLNAQGALGFLYLGDYVFSDGTYSQYSKNLMQPTTYSYELSPFSTTAEHSLEILNTAGRKGYYFFAPYYFNEGIHALFIQSHADANHFSYKALTVVASSAGFLAQANAEGQLGYRYIGQYQFSDGVKALYMSDGSQNSTLVYEVLESKTIPGAFVEQASEKGKLGFRLTSNHMFNDGSFSIYIKDSTRNDSFNFTLKPIVGLMQNSTDYLKDVNEAGGQKKRLLGIRVFLADHSLSQSYVFIGGSDYTQYSPFGM
jgi:hypothetical protein